MSTCANCGADILFGGVRVGANIYCYERCRVQGENADTAQRQAQLAYENRLARLRSTPNDPKLRQEALEAGRVFAAWKRRKQGGVVTLYDETAIGNDIAAACSSGLGAQASSSAADFSVIERRLERLQLLKERSLISEEEFQKKRTEVLSEL